MRHLILSRELPPAAYPGGGIGTYVANISRLLADAGDVVHVIGERWRRAPAGQAVECDGRLVIHRVPATEPLPQPGRPLRWDEVSLLRGTPFPAQAWGWNAALLAERLVESEGIDVIEAQEWEAPLYYFLLRRALGMGPGRQPPCIVHLHSPSEFIWRHNKWPLSRPDYLPMRRQEEYCIAAADALLCPSRYLAQQCEDRYGLPRDSISTVPYPLGDFATVPRSHSATAGPVVCVGRLEPRKGQVEFVEAAIRVCDEFPAARFEFLGADTPYRDGTSVGDHVRSVIPRRFRGRFRFPGAVPRSALAGHLAEASLAAVPSRWENFPNTCMEAMAAGLPVLASPNGGMVEMLQDGVTGWIAESQRPVDLAAALRRALATSPAERAAMGQAAAASIRAQCGATSVVESHRRVRSRVVESGAVSSHRLATPGGRPAEVTDATAQQGVAVACVDHEGAIARALHPATAEPSIGLAITLAHFEVDVDAMRTAADVLARNPGVGVIAGWIDQNPALSAMAPPTFPYQWLANDATGVVVFRREALERAWAGSGGSTGEEGLWELVNAVLAAGWTGAAVPVVMGRPQSRDPSQADLGDVAVPDRGEKLRWFREKYPEHFARDDGMLAFLIDAGVLVAEQLHRGSRRINYPVADRWRNLSADEIWRLSLRDKLALMGAALEDPRRTMAWLRNNWPPQLGARSPASGTPDTR